MALGGEKFFISRICSAFMACENFGQPLMRGGCRYWMEECPRLFPVCRGGWTSGSLEPNLLSNLIWLSHAVFDTMGNFIPSPAVFLSRSGYYPESCTRVRYEYCTVRHDELLVTTLLPLTTHSQWPSYSGPGMILYFQNIPRVKFASRQRVYYLSLY